MTIVVVAVSSDGIALASDSRTTEQLNSGHRRVASDSAHKVFEAFERYAVATYGLGVIGEKTVHSLFGEWKASVGDSPPDDPKMFCDSLGKFFTDLFPAPRGPSASSVGQGWPLGFLVASYETTGVGSVWEVRVRSTNHDTAPLGTTSDGPAVWYRGQTSAIRRLIVGVDLDEARDHRFQIPDELAERLKTLHYEYVGPTTTQDAIDLAWFLVELTINTQRFTDGTVVTRKRDNRGPIPGCGGPVQAIAVEPGSITWIARNRPAAPGTRRAPLD